MYQKNDLIVYKKDVCKIIDIKEIDNYKYLFLVPINDTSLKIQVPINNRDIRKLISKEEVNKIINKMPSIEIIKNNNRLLENEYRNLLKEGSYESLIKIIKTTYLRNKERIDNNKKKQEKDDYYFNLAEKYLYTEFSFALGMNFNDTKNYVIKKVKENLG